MGRDVVAEIRRATRRKFRAEDKIRIVLEGLGGEISVSQLCRRESISPALYYKWSKAFREAVVVSRRVGVILFDVEERGRANVVSATTGEETAGYSTVYRLAGVVTIFCGGRVGFFKKNISDTMVVSGIGFCSPGGTTSGAGLLKLCAAARRKVHSSEAPMGTPVTGGV